MSVSGRHSLAKGGLALGLAAVANLGLLWFLAGLNHPPVLRAEKPIGIRLIEIQVDPTPKGVTTTLDHNRQPEGVEVLESTVALAEPETSSARSVLEFDVLPRELQPLAVSAVPTPVLVPRDHAAARAPVRAPKTEGAFARSKAKQSPSTPLWTGPVEIGTVDTPPREVRVRDPRYPKVARRRGLEGVVTAKIVIDRDGRVARVEILEVQGHRSFGKAVEQAAEEWEYTPARHQGRVVSVWGVKTIQFRLDGGSF